MAKKAAQLLLAHINQGRSPLYRWLKENYSEFSVVIRSQRRPSWEALAKTARDCGQGNPSRQTVRKAWLRLEEDMATQPNNLRVTSQRIRGPTAKVPSPSTQTAEDHDNDPPPDRYTFKRAKPR